MVTIKSIDDFIKFKEFTTRPICYVYYKETLLNTYYVGFTTQHGYHYLKNHHKMKKIKDAIKNGFSIQIYTKYNEDSLIKILKPKLNIVKGTGICGRHINYVDLKSVGEVISMCKFKLTYEDKKREYHIQNTIYKKIYKNIYSNYHTLWDNLFKNKNQFVSIHSDMIKYLIEKCKIPANSIMLTTFTCAAANDMEQRLKEMIGEKSKEVTIGTIDSIALRIITENNLLTDKIYFIQEHIHMFNQFLKSENSITFKSGIKYLFIDEFQDINDEQFEFIQEMYLSGSNVCVVGDDYQNSVKIWGSPWQPEFCNWAFNLPRMGDQLNEVWHKIPADIDILVTHGPACGYLDCVVGQYDNLGCELLTERIKEIKPKIHVCGHIHTGYGYVFDGNTHFINAAVLNEQYVYAQKPLTINWDPIENKVVFLD
jgi:hypothetical protein